MLFVKSIHVLLQPSITTADLEKCNHDLYKFVGECQIYYGEGEITFNLHSLMHLAVSVQQSGPLWATSAFPYENGIFKMKQQISGPNGIDQCCNRPLLLLPQLRKFCILFHIRFCIWFRIFIAEAYRNFLEMARLTISGKRLSALTAYFPNVTVGRLPSDPACAYRNCLYFLVINYYAVISQSP